MSQHPHASTHSTGLLPANAAIRGRLPTLLLIVSALWLVVVSLVVAQSSETLRFTPVFGGIAIVLALTSYGSWSYNPTWDDWSRIALWFSFGVTLSVWLIGIWSIGWLVFPVVLPIVVSLVTWPREADQPIANRECLIAEFAGFFATPIVLQIVFDLVGN